jgi:hypothetical protein
MHRHHQDVLGGRQPEEPHPQERAPSQVERAASLRLASALDLFQAIGRARARDLVLREDDNDITANDLDRPMLPPWEHRPQDLVSFHDLRQASFQEIDVQGPQEVEGNRYVVGRRAGSDLLVEPNLLLDQRELGRTPGPDLNTLD